MIAGAAGSIFGGGGAAGYSASSAASSTADQRSGINVGGINTGSQGGIDQTTLLVLIGAALLAALVLRR